MGVPAGWDGVVVQVVAVDEPVEPGGKAVQLIGSCCRVEVAPADDLGIGQCAEAKGLK